ncbi:hypothetical protein BDV09DRAFT_88405 [Aspergillus tetrazonus]
MQRRLIENHPPSPPQSTDGDFASDASQFGDMYPLYDTPEPYGGAGQGHDESFNEQSSVTINMRYAPTAEYPQNASLHHPVRTWPFSPTAEYSRQELSQAQVLHNGARFSTPPADDGFASGSLDSAASARWPSPARRQHASRARVLRSPRQRRRAKNRSSTDSGFVLTEPLSVLTKDMTHVPLKDMESHVNRPIEERLADTAKNDGKIPRPMNSFMLYRSAYANRVKEYFRQQNHQVVSSASGASWNKETPEIRAKYERLAVIEKRNHLKAYPGYKFTPAKDKKKRSTFDDSHSFSGEFTPEGSPAQRNISRNSTFSTPELGSGWNGGHPTPPDMGDHGLPTDGYFPSLWPTSHPARQPVGMMLTSDPSHFMQPASNPEEMHYAPSTTLAGLPGAAHHDLLQPQGGQVDPALLNYPGTTLHPEGDSQVYGHSHYQMWQEGNNNVYAPFEASMEPSPDHYAGAPSIQPGMAGHETWDSSHGATLEPAGGDFDNWLNQPAGY